MHNTVIGLFLFPYACIIDDYFKACFWPLEHPIKGLTKITCLHCKTKMQSALNLDLHALLLLASLNCPTHHAMHAYNWVFWGSLLNVRYRFNAVTVSLFKLWIACLFSAWSNACLAVSILRHSIGCKSKAHVALRQSQLVCSSYELLFCFYAWTSFFGKVVSPPGGEPA